MPLTTFRFFIFALVLVIVYFIVPKKAQWIVLLASSLTFYGLAGIENSFYIIITATTTFFAALGIEKLNLSCKSWLKENKELLPKEERKAYKQKNVNKRKAILVVTLVINFGLLCSFKYINFIIDQINVFIRGGGGTEISALSLIIPLGISFYTFTSMGYLVDVYWEKNEAQKNYFKMLLFTSFFPQITQGPISEYRQLGHQLYASHKFEYKNFSWGVQRFMWGLLKKLAIADTAAVFVRSVFENYNDYSGISVFIGALLYAIQIYADFSGYMDMMCGLCQIMGIELAENFERPYFSKSVSEYWRRWHITLGAWFKTYVYYAVGFSRFAQWVGKKGQKTLGKTFAKNMPGTIALIIVWFTTGLWHGANWGYIIWGLLNGVFIIATLWLEPFYDWMKKIFRINESTWLWRAFQVLRTFILVVFIKVLPEVGDLSDGLGLWSRIFTDHTIPHSLGQLLPFVESNMKTNFVVMCVLTIVLFIFSMIQRKHPVRESFNKIPLVIRVLILALVFVVAIEFGARSDGLNGAFLYAQF